MLFGNENGNPSIPQKRENDVQPCHGCVHYNKILESILSEQNVNKKNRKINDSLPFPKRQVSPQSLCSILTNPRKDRDGTLMQTILRFSSIRSNAIPPAMCPKICLCLFVNRSSDGVIIS